MNQVEGIPKDSWQTALKIPPNSHVVITVHTSVYMCNPLQQLDMIANNALREAKYFGQLPVFCGKWVLGKIYTYIWVLNSTFTEKSWNENL